MGNLLWHYIKTPRSTVDVDFTTDIQLEIDQVLKDFSSVQTTGCTFLVKTHNAVESVEKSGLAVQIKVAACHRFIGGNTRMKDFDDPYSIVKANKKFDAKLIQKIAIEREVEISLDPKWINKQMNETWMEYTQKKVYKDASDLPKDLVQLIDTNNEFLSNVTKLTK